MKKRITSSVLKKLLLFTLLFALAQGVVITSSYTTETVQAAKVKKGLKKEGKYYYYYVNGKRVKNQWKTVKVKSNGKTVSYRYYFGKNGRAYAAPNLKSDYGYKQNIVVKKIGKYYYGFNRYGRMVKSGYYNNPQKFDKNGDSYTYYFNAKGRLVSSKSKAIRKAAAYGKDAAAVRKILGKPIKEIKQNSCFGEPGDDYMLRYANIDVSVHRYPDGREMMFGIFPR